MQHFALTNDSRIDSIQEQVKHTTSLDAAKLAFGYVSG